jgi:ubiquinone/menaquinone biosynthesis C-methylase UbiE
MNPRIKTESTASSITLQHEGEKNKIDGYFAAESSRWNDIYQKEDVYAVIHQDRRAIALQYIQELSLPQNARILEIGCGAGLTAVDLANLGYTIEAVDSVEEMIDLTRQNAVKFRVEKLIHANVMDLLNLQFPDKTFDLVIALGVAPWLADLRMALKEITRVLGPRGYCLINVDNRWRLNHLLDPIEFPPLAGLKEKTRIILEKAGLVKFSNDPRPKRHTAKEFDAMLESVCLVKLKYRMIGFGPFSFLKTPLFPDAFGIRLHHYLQNAADRGNRLLRSTGSQYLVLVQKQ